MNVEELYRCEIQKTPRTKNKKSLKKTKNQLEKIKQKIQKKGHFKT